jgi:two-component system, sensor histidine kinase
MELHKLLQRQLSKIYPDFNLEDEKLLKLLRAVSDAYTANERDKLLSEHAFSLSEQEYNSINAKLQVEVANRKTSIDRLKATFSTIDDDPILKNSDEDLLGIVNYVKNQVAKRKDTEAELDSNAQRMTTLLGSLQTGILIETENRKVAYVNSTLCQLLGLFSSPKSMEGKDCYAFDERILSLVSNPHENAERINQIILDRKPVQNETLELNDGRVIERDFRQYTDVTERRNAQAILKASEEKYRSIIANMNMGLLEVDSDNIILFANQSFCDMTRISAETIQHKNIDELMAGIIHPDYAANHQVNFSDNASDTYELAIRNHRGALKWWLISRAARYNDKKEKIGSVGIFVDITKQKEIEKELMLARESAILSSQAKESFLANMSHEIRTPLNGVIGFIRELIKEDLTETQYNYAESAQKASKHLLSIVNNILDLSKIEANELNLSALDFSLEEVASDVQKILITQALDKEIELRMHFDHNIQPALVGDALRIRQILINIVGNSLKFTEHGYVSIACNSLGKTEKIQNVQITIQDTGIGMEQEFVERIYEKFQQEDHSSSRKFGGTGLGMAITKELIELMEGRIEITSEKGVGTCTHLFLSFPIGNEEQLLQSSEFNANHHLNFKRILLVDDSQMNRIIASKAIERYPIMITEAANGIEAIAMIKNHTFDLILMDMQMPIMGGLEATTIIRSELKLDVPIVALTANAFKSEIEKCMASGMNDYITKPFEENDLIDVISRNMGKNIITEKPKSFITKSTKLISPVESDTSLSTPLYQLEALKQIFANDENSLAETIAIFVESLDESASELKDAMDNNDVLFMKSTLHKIRPSFEFFGMTSTIPHVIKIENASIHTNIKDLKSAIDVILENMRVVAHELRMHQSS